MSDCGIFGMISNGPAVRQEAAKALFAMENRGKQSCGIIGYDSCRQAFDSPIRHLGPASLVFGKKNCFPKDKCNLAIGHNRYATSGSSLKKDIQPFYTQRSGLALAHNGQVLNIISLKKKLNAAGWSFFTSCDAETILFALCQNMVDRKFYKAQSTEEFVYQKLFPALEELMNTSGEGYSVKGAYSVVAILDKKGLLAFKDPHGIRPLCFAGRQSDSYSTYAFASETTALNFLENYHAIRELKPGEAIFIDFNLKVYSQLILPKQEAFCSFEQVYFGEIDSFLREHYIYEAREALGLALSEEFAGLKERVDVVMPVPDSPIPAAKALAKVWDKEEGGIVKRRFKTERGFQAPTPYEREKTATEKYVFIKSKIKEKRVALVDDSIVRGDVSRKVVKRCRDLGAKEIHFFSTYPPHKYSCVFGIDTPEQGELAFNKYGSLEKFRESIQADSINYLSLEGMLKATNLSRDTACTACLTGRYPVDISEYQEYQNLRKKERAEFE